MAVIVVPVVLTPAGQRAVETAKQEAVLRDAELVLVGNTTVTESFAEDATTLSEYIVQLEKDLIGEGFRTTSEWTMGSDLAREVLAVARRLNAILIVVGIRQRTPTGKALLGSYEQDILLDAPCPVLTVRDDWGG